MKRKLILVFAAISLIALLALASANMTKVSAETYSGSCGEGVTYELDTSTGVLTISGSGGMIPYSEKSYNGTYATSAPWGQYYSSIKTVSINSGVARIGNYAFTGCTGLTSITIPDSVTSIGWYAFTGCTGLTSITIPDSVTSIGSSAFSYCKGLTSITIPDSVTSIGNNAFYGCTGLKEMTVPGTIYMYYAFGNTYPTWVEKVTIVGDTIRNQAFSGCTGLTSIIIPDSVTSIGNQAFYNCTNLTNITIPSSVTSIGGADSFDGCSVYLTAQVVEGSYAHAFCRRYSIPFEFYTPTSGPLLSGKVALSGKAEVGQTLTATVSGLNASADKVSYRWYRDGVAIKRATGTEYVVTYSDVGRQITFEVTADGYSGKIASSPVVPVVLAPEGAPALYFESREVTPDDVVGIELLIKNNSGIDTLIVTPALPEGFEFIGVTNGDVFKNMESGRFSAVFDTSTGEDGVVAIFSIRVPEKISNGEYELCFDVIDCATADEKLALVTSEKGSLTVSVICYGDANGDGDINARDIVRMKRYFAEIDPQTGNSTAALEKGADTNGDGSITALDLIRLKKYLAGYNKETQSSTVPLGPTH